MIDGHPHLNGLGPVVKGGSVFQLLFCHHKARGKNRGSRAFERNHSGPSLFQKPKEHHIIDVGESIAIAPSQIDINNPFV